MSFVGSLMTFVNKSRLAYLPALLILSAALVTTVFGGNYVFAQMQTPDGEERNRGGDNAGGNSDTNGNDHTNEGKGNSENVADNGNAGEGGFGDTQPQREGVHDNEEQTSGEGAQGGTVSDPTIPEEELGDDGEIKSKCFGKVISHEAQEHKEEGSDEERLGAHARDPLPGDGDNETPRQGIGNQDQGHPAAHGAFNSQFDDDDAENVEENC